MRQRQIEHESGDDTTHNLDESQRNELEAIINDFNVIKRESMGKDMKRMILIKAQLVKNVERVNFYFKQ